MQFTHQFIAAGRHSPDTDTNQYALGVVFAVDSGASVIQEALGSIGNNALAMTAIDYAYVNSVVVIATIKPPNFLGEMSLIDKEFRSAGVRSRSATTLLQLSNDNLHTFAKHYRNGFTWVVVNIARILSTRLREMNQRLAKLSQASKGDAKD